MRILLFTKYEDIGASSRVRCLQYLSQLKERGVDIDVKPLITNAMLSEKFGSNKTHSIWKSFTQYIKRIYQTKNVKNYDIVWVQKEFLPFIPFWIEFLILRKSKALILDIDDAEFLKYQSGVKRFFLRNKYKKIACNYQAIIVGNDYLNKRFADWGGLPITIPSVISYREYETVSTNMQKRHSDIPFIIGWIGSPSTEKYIDLIIPALEKFCSFLDAPIKLHLIGASKKMENKSIYINVIPWDKFTEVEEISRFDIGIMPLEQSEWESGKCSFKAIQCMGAGKPVIVSPTNANVQLVAHQVNGLIAQTEEEWFDAFNALYSSPEICAGMGERNRLKIKNGYSVESQVETMHGLFSQIIRGQS